MKMSDEPYTIIHLGNAYDFVIKNINTKINSLIQFARSSETAEDAK